MYLVYILKHLIEKAYARFFKNNFCLFDNWQQFKSIMRKKKGTNSLSKLLTCSSQTTSILMDGWMRCVCVDMGLYDTRIDTSSVPRPPAKVGGYSLCNHWAQVPLGTLSFQFKALFLCSPFFQTHPQFPGLRSEKKIWLEKLPSFQNSLGNRNCINSDTHTDIENTTWTSECVCVCVYSSNCKKGPYSFPY